eukprot:1219033-Pleurochrysis_carterae.AAC.4
MHHEAECTRKNLQCAVEQLSPDRGQAAQGEHPARHQAAPINRKGETKRALAQEVVNARRELDVSRASSNRLRGESTACFRAEQRVHDKEEDNAELRSKVSDLESLLAAERFKMAAATTTRAELQARVDQLQARVEHLQGSLRVQAALIQSETQVAARVRATAKEFEKDLAQSNKANTEQLQSKLDDAEENYATVLRQLADNS